MKTLKNLNIGNESYYLLFITLLALVYFMPVLLYIAILMVISTMLILEGMKLNLWFGFNKKTEISNPTKSPFISVHLATYNEPPQMVINTIQSILNQYYSDFEIIVVDNNSNRCTSP